MSAFGTAAATDLFTTLEGIVGASHISESPTGGVLVRPSSAAEVSEIIVTARRAGAAVTPLGNAARPGGPAADSARPRIALDLRRMCHVLRLDETSLVVHAQAGLTAHALEQILGPRGLSLGDFPPAALGSTIGGLLAVRTPGKSTRRHGTVEDAVLGISAILPDGRAVHTRIAPRRSSGPDLARAVCGSEGALAVITSAVLRVHRRPEARLLSAHLLPSFADGLAAVRLALREEASPAALRLHDAADGVAHFGDRACADGEAILVAATAGPTDLAACDRDLIASAVHAVGGRALAEDFAELWWRRRTGRDATEALTPTLQVSATPGRLADVYEAACTAAAEHDVAARAHASRLSLDGGVLFITLTAGDEAIPVEHPARAAVEAAAARAGAFLLGTINPVLDPYFVSLRDILDPDRVLNPEVLED